MVNTGKPSSACYTCRKRKVKCDEAIPYCRNCIRIGKLCPGYRKPGDAIFKSHYGGIKVEPHDESGKVLTAEWISDDRMQPVGHGSPLKWHSQEYPHRSWPEQQEPNPDPTQQSAYHFNAERQDDLHTMTALAHTSSDWLRHPEPLPTLPIDVPEHALCYSLFQFDKNSRVQYSIDTFAFLPRLISDAGPDSAVYQAMRACATINLANRAGPVDLNEETTSEYARAISLVNTSLQRPDEQLTDETLIAVWLLGMRELLIEVAGRSVPSESPRVAMNRRQVHTDGTISLLRLRGEEQMQRPLGKHIFSTILSAMHWRGLFMGQEPTKEFLQLEALQSRMSPFLPNAFTKLRAFFHGVTKLRARIRNLVDMCQWKKCDSYTIIGSYLKAAQKLESKMDGWCDVPTWHPQRVVPGTVAPGTDKIYALFTFYDWNPFFLWNRYLVAKIALHAGLLDAFKLLPEQQLYFEPTGYVCTTELKRQHGSALRGTADQFLGIIGYAFGDVGPPIKTDHDRAEEQKEHEMNVVGSLQVFQPLLYLTRLEYITSVQREAVAKALQMMTVAYTTR